MHNGLDFGATVGTAFKSVCNGLVVHAGDGSPFAAGPRSIIVMCGNTYVLYGHTSSESVSKGQTVTVGQVLNTIRYCQGRWSNRFSFLSRQLEPLDTLAPLTSTLKSAQSLPLSGSEESRNVYRHNEIIKWYSNRGNMNAWVHPVNPGTSFNPRILFSGLDGYFNGQRFVALFFATN